MGKTIAQTSLLDLQHEHFKILASHCSTFSHVKLNKDRNIILSKGHNRFFLLQQQLNCKRPSTGNCENSNISKGSPNDVSVPVWSKSGIGSEDRVQTSLFRSNMSLVTLKIRPRSPKLNHFFDAPNDESVSVWSKLGHWFRR